MFDVTKDNCNHCKIKQPTCWSNFFCFLTFCKIILKMQDVKVVLFSKVCCVKNSSYARDS